MAKILEFKNLLIKRLTDIVSELENILPQWISVSERLPENAQINLGCFYARSTTEPNELTVRELIFNRDCQEWFCDGFNIKEYGWEITHWMPLPRPPEAE